MKNNYLVELIVSAILVTLILLLANPFHFWMPNSMHLAIIAFLIVAFGAFAVFIWREKPHDEREVLHRAMAGRAGFLAGAGVLTIAIIAQSYNYQDVDLWLVGALASMVLAKFFMFVYGRVKY